MIVVIGGLPGVGKTTVARQLAGRLGAAHVRIDALESALVTTGLLPPAGDVGPAGYDLALAVADTCLAAGSDVVADAVFPIAVSRRPWAQLAERRGVPIHWVRLVCTDTAEHRRRVETRVPDLPAAGRPDWAAVTARETDEWSEPHVVVDTADGDPVTEIERRLDTPAAVVRRHVEAFGARDVERVVAGLSDDVSWRSGGGSAEGVAELREVLTEVFALTTARLDISRLVARGGTVAAELLSRTHVDGLPVTSAVSAWYEVRDGRIATARIYRGSGAAS